MSSRQYQQRVALETTFGEQPAGDFYEVNLPGFDPNISANQNASGRVRRDLAMQRGASTAPTVTAQSNTGYGHRYGGEHLLRQSAYGSLERATILATAEEVSAADNAIIRAAGWSGTGVTPGTMVILEGSQGPNDAKVLAPIIAIDGTAAIVHSDFVDLADEVAAFTVRNRSSLRAEGEVHTLHFESWNGTTAAGDVLRGLLMNSWGFTIPWGDQGKQPFSQSFGGTALAWDSIGAQLVANTITAPEGPVYNSGSGFGVRANPTLGFGLRFNGTVLSQIQWKNIQLQMQIQGTGKGGAGDDNFQRFDRQADIDVTLTLTFGRKEAGSNTHQDLFIAGARSTMSSSASAEIGFGFQDDQNRGEYHFMPALACQSLTMPSTGDSNDECTAVFKSYGEPDPLWTPLNSTYFDVL